MNISNALKQVALTLLIGVGVGVVGTEAAALRDYDRTAYGNELEAGAVEGILLLLLLRPRARTGKNNTSLELNHGS